MRKKPKFIYLALCLIGALVTLVTACTSPSDEPTPPTNVPQVLRMNIAGEPATIDPNRASWSTERSVIMQVFEGLLSFNQDLSLNAAVAKEIPTVANKGISADGMTYTFKLRNNVTWSDGQKLTAKDLEYSIKRLFDPTLAAEYASFFFDIVGSEDYFSSGDKDAAAQAQLKAAIGVKAIDETTLEIKLAQPRPTFLQLMALWPVYPVREDIITKYGDTWTEPPNYIGNGPFILTEWEHQDHITFKPNPNYWGTKKAKLTELTFKMITDANAALAAYKNNEMDMSGVPAGTEKATIADPVLSKQLVRYPELVVFAFQFNVAKSPFDNVNLRKALNAALDRESFINNVRAGVGKPAYSWIPPGMPGYDENLGSNYHFNVQKAKQFLADAGYASGADVPELKMQYADTGINPTIAQFVQAQMKENLGINVSIEPMERKAFSQAVNEENYTWAWYGWGADYPDPDNFLPELFGTDAGNNHTNYSNPAFDELATAAKKELDNTKRLKMWADAQKMVVDDAPVLFMNYRERFVLVNPRVAGMKTTGMDGDVPGDMFLNEVYVTK